MSSSEYKTKVEVGFVAGTSDDPMIRVALPEGRWNLGEEVEVTVRHLPPPVPPRLKRGWWVRWWTALEAWRT